MNFDNDSSRNVVIFGVYNSVSIHSGNRKNNFVVLRECRIDENKDNCGSGEINFRITCTKPNSKLYLNLYCNGQKNCK